MRGLVIPIVDVSDRWVEVVPWQGLEGIDPPRLPGGREIALDGILRFGKKRDTLLTQDNSHYLSFVFRWLVEQKAPARVLDVVWDIGLALMTKERAAKGDNDVLVNRWAVMRRAGVDYGEGYFSQLAGGPANPADEIDFDSALEIDSDSLPPARPRDEDEWGQEPDPYLNGGLSWSK